MKTIFNSRQWRRSRREQARVRQ